MAHDDNANTDRWVDERLSALVTNGQDAEWQPDTRARLSAAHARRKSWHARRVRMAVAGAAAAAVVVAAPATRAFGARCVAACVSATARVSQLLGVDGPEGM